MSGRGKRIWAPQLSFDGAYQEVLQFLKRCSDHQLAVLPTRHTLYRAYLMDGTWPAMDGQDLTRFMRFGYGNDPSGDRAKQALARLLAVAVKAHYFLAAQASVPQEPSVILLPDLAEPGLYRHGILYPLQVPADGRSPGRQRTLVVAEWDVGLSASRQPQLPRADEFPVVLAPRGRMLDKKHWDTLKAQGEQHPWFEASSHPGRKRLLDQVNSCTQREGFPYGTLLSYPKGINEDIRQTGAMWARGIRSWFLPAGFDLAPVKGYLDELIASGTDEQMRRRWWERRSEERPSYPVKSTTAPAADGNAE